MGGQYVFGTLQATVGVEITVGASGDPQALRGKCVGLWVGETGNLEVSFIGDSDTYVTIVGVPAGTFVQGRFANLERVDQGTTADSIVSFHVSGNWRGI